jgi:hypothetical protein
LKEADGGWNQEAAGKTVDQPAAALVKPAAAAAVPAAAAEAAVPAAVEAVVPAVAAAVGQLEQKGINSASGGCTESLKICIRSKKLFKILIMTKFADKKCFKYRPT